jgi:hypothetical protein
MTNEIVNLFNIMILNKKSVENLLRQDTGETGESREEDSSCLVSTRLLPRLLLSPPCLPMVKGAARLHSLSSLTKTQVVETGRSD